MSERYSTNELVQIVKNGMLFVEGSKAIISRLGAADRLCEAARELSCVAGLRGDDELPHPSDDPKMWTARMQTAWDDLRATIAAMILQEAGKGGK